MNCSCVLKKALILLAATIALSFISCAQMGYITGHKAEPLPAGETSSRPGVYHDGNWIIARAAMHTHTIISDGKRTPEDLLKLAHRENIAILAITDHREGGIKLSNGIRVPLSGVEQIGYEAYFKRLSSLRDTYKDMILLIGLEVNPNLYNIGKFPHMVILNQNDHFTVYAINDPEIFKRMPVWRTVNSKPDFPPGLVPIQKFVDYIVDNSGIVVGAHMYSPQDTWFGPVHFVTDSLTDLIHDLHGLTAFAILPETYTDQAAGPGGLWDATLLEYLMGMRDQAPWALGDSDYHEGVGPDLVRGTTLFYMREFTEQEVYSCMRQGRMVALMGPYFQDIYVSEFSVGQTDRPAKEKVMFGQSVTLNGTPVVRFSLNRKIPDARVRLIRNGKIVKEVKDSSLEFADSEVYEKKLPAFYRVEVIAPDMPIAGDAAYPEAHISRLYTNPIFAHQAPLVSNNR